VPSLVILKPPYYVSDSSIHGRGLFAARRIPKDTVLGIYEGPITHEDGMYVLWVEDEDGKLFGIDGQNDLRFVNHSHQPNAIFLGDELVTLRAIRPDEEITFHYGEEWEDLDGEEGEEYDEREDAIGA
jgi:SET domain-containing protein